MFRRLEDQPNRCTFCYKHRREVWKLISSPREDGPIVNICDECVATCSFILKDQREQAAVDAIAGEATVLSLLQAVERWIQKDRAGDAAPELAQLREIARGVFSATIIEPPGG